VKILGYALITVGFLAGAFFAAQPEPRQSSEAPLQVTVAMAEKSPIPLMPFLGSLGLGILGVVAVRRALRQEATHEDRLAADIEAVETSLAALVEKVEALEREKGEIDVDELRHVIDDRFPADLDAFVQARQSIAHSFSLQAYADVMSPFAAGERHLNRVWSASTDGYIDEAHTYISLARQEFEHALEVFREVKAAPRAVNP
jgi:hypothetical protein